jgi:hypothetical protein
MTSFIVLPTPTTSIAAFGMAFAVAFVGQSHRPAFEI